MKRKVLLLGLLGLFMVSQKSNAQNCSLICPATVSVSNTLHQCGANVNYPSPTLSGSCSGVTITSTPASGSFFPVGMTTVTSTARNNAGLVATCTFSVTVNDNEAPVISNLNAVPPTLWPPNHKMVPVTINYNATDNCPGNISCQLSVTSNEPVNSTGDGNTAPDWIVVNNHLVDLRAERKGNGDGRVYTIKVTCADQHGNSSSSSTNVTVAHDQGQNGTKGNDKDLSVQCQPNPSKNNFNFIVNSSNHNDKINVKICDWSSRVVDSKMNLTSGQTFILGNNLKPGIYFAQVQQGTVTTQLKIVKE